MPRICEYLKGPEEGTGFCGAGVAGGYELPDVGSGSSGRKGRSFNL